MAIPGNLDAFLRRKELAVALTEAGFPTAEATLATKATRGSGPPFRLYGRIPIYRWGDALDWARSRLSDLVSSTSEHDAHRQHPTSTTPKPISPHSQCTPQAPRAAAAAPPGNAVAIKENLPPP
jgi:hypothetical protein